MMMMSMSLVLKKVGSRKMEEDQIIKAATVARKKWEARNG